MVVGYTYCIFASMFTPTCYALGYPGAGRCRNMYVMFLYLYLVFLEFYVVGWVRNKVQIDPKEMVKTTQVVIPFAFIAVILLVLAQDANNYMSLSAVKSMYYKEAQLYHVIHSERESQLRGDEQQVAVRTCPIRPHLLFFDDITTGASSDIKKATKVARKMVTRYGMSENIGVINYDNDDDEVFIGRDLAHAKSHSELVASKIDEEVKIIIDDCYKKAKDIIIENKDVLESCAQLLLEKEKISREEFEALF